MIGCLAITGTEKQKIPSKPAIMRAFLRLRLASAGNMPHPQAPFFYGMTNGTIWLDAMIGARYHATTLQFVMVLTSHKSFIYKEMMGEMSGNFEHGILKANRDRCHAN